VAALPKSGIRDFFELVAKMKGQDVISLGVGEPDFVTPWNIREAAIFALERGKTYYTSNLGLIELRRAISAYVTEHFGVDYRPDDQVIVTVGVSEALDLALRAFCNPGDKVMFHQPCYVSYHPSIALVHGQAVGVPTYAQDNFALTAGALRAAWQPGCKILMLNLPCNPTGGTCDRVQLEAIAAFCREKDLLVLSDEIYSELTFEGTHTSIASLPGMAERTISCSSLSKTFSITGWRLGYLHAPPEIIAQARKVHDFLTVGAAAPLQHAVVTALGFPPAYYTQLGAEYQAQRDVLLSYLERTGLAYTRPEGAYFVMLDISPFGYESDVEFSHWMTREIGVAPVPGSSFFAKGENRYVRLNFAKKPATLHAAGERLLRLREGRKA
jgi:aminotransferase